MKLAVDLTLAELGVIYEAVQYYNNVLKFNVNAMHSTEEERELAGAKVAVLNGLIGDDLS